MSNNITYEQAGVDYGVLDAFKRLCQAAAARTAAKDSRINVLSASRGESATVVEFPMFYAAHVDEGLGTKNVVADIMEQLTGSTYYFSLGIDTVAAIVNDVTTAGALPAAINMHLAVGHADWFKNTTRYSAFVEGFVEGCNEAGCAWGGGETPTLPGIIDRESAVLAGSCLGVIYDKRHYISGDLEAGDEFVLVASNGPHANGISLLRRIADELPAGYMTDIGGETFGAFILRPSVIYARLIRALQHSSIAPKYCVNITGHGWRKLMRNRRTFRYIVSNCGSMEPFYEYLIRHDLISVSEAYSTLNMGAGYAVFVKASDVQGTIAKAEECGYRAWRGGIVTSAEDASSVCLEEHGIEFSAESMIIR
jgi:phosphoribosylformylglycinamidine cyclo-ligase